MSLSRKDYQAIATIIVGLDDLGITDIEREEIAARFAAYLGEDNPAFDEELFFKACLG